MSEKTDFILKIIEDLAMPLILSADRVELEKLDDKKEPPNDLDERIAKSAATLLSGAVKFGMDLDKSLEFSKNETESENLRLTLTTASARLMADRYERTGKIPADKDFEKIKTSIQSVIGFSDHFTSGPLPEEARVQAEYMDAFAPVIDVVAEYSFGRSGNKILPEIASRLMDMTHQLSGIKFGEDKTSRAAVSYELGILRTVARIYAAAHKMEKDRIMAMSDDEREKMVAGNGGEIPLQPVWDAFQMRLALMDVLTEALFPGALDAEGQDGAKATLENPSEQENKPVSAEPDSSETPTGTGTGSDAGAESGDDGGDDAMSALFGGPDSEQGEQSVQQNRSAQAAVPPKAQPPVAPPSTSPAEPEQPPRESAADESGEKKKGDDDDDPMSFF